MSRTLVLVMVAGVVGCGQVCEHTDFWLFDGQMCVDADDSGLTEAEIAAVADASSSAIAESWPEAAACAHGESGSLERTGILFVDKRQCGGDDVCILDLGDDLWVEVEAPVTASICAKQVRIGQALLRLLATRCMQGTQQAVGCGLWCTDEPTCATPSSQGSPERSMREAVGCSM